MATDIRVVITMACTECRARNYATTKNRRKQTERLELKKHCPVCRKHTVHREAK
ncbi:MAG: 50S ribosomal protein L33 [Armatimonadota bacterium]|nr:MAG: 50S ribosomal protein L33 [Armatimonadota bacterium]